MSTEDSASHITLSSCATTLPWWFWLLMVQADIMQRFCWAQSDPGIPSKGTETAKKASWLQLDVHCHLFWAPQCTMHIATQYQPPLLSHFGSIVDVSKVLFWINNVASSQWILQYTWITINKCNSHESGNICNPGFGKKMKALYQRLTQSCEILYKEQSKFWSCQWHDSGKIIIDRNNITWIGWQPWQKYNYENYRRNVH